MKRPGANLLIAALFASVWLVGVERVATAQEASANHSASSLAAVTPDELAAVRAAEKARIEVIDQVYGTVVAIYGNDRQGGGSGVLFDPAGYALTNFHVVSAAGEEGWAGLADGRLYRWKLLGFDPGGDLAIIQLSGKDKFPYAPIGDSNQVRLGDWAMAMGNPFTLAEDQRPTVTLGVVSGIERYQPGAGKNSLVYGNCIQVDSSINPGNSGGPLFNLRGEVIGINGRASFKERGRVNVGVGYAISAEQVKNFLPDLLASKLCMHGTLDAVFADRDDKTICYSMNLDSPIAQAGLGLGDVLVEFAGHKIRNANQFANLISTLPAEWPVKVVFEREGETHEAWVRLDGLPYAQRKQQAEKPPMPGDPQPEPAEGEEPSKVKPQAEQGKIRNAELNRQEAERLLKEWGEQTQAATGSLERLRGGQMEISIIDRRIGDEPVERRRWTWAADGRFREEELDLDSGEPTGVSYGFDGKVYWRRDVDGKVITKEGDDFGLEKVDHIPVLVLANLFRAEPKAAFAELELEGGDYVAGQRAYRLRGKLQSGQTIWLWLSVFDRQGQLQPQLIKAAADDGTGQRSEDGWLFDDRQTLSDVHVPTSYVLVEGLPETERMIVTAEAPKLWTEDLPEDQFKRPDDAQAE